MIVTSKKRDSKILRRAHKKHDAQDAEFHVQAWSTNGGWATVTLAMDDRLYYFRLADAELVCLYSDLEKVPVIKNRKLR